MKHPKLLLWLTLASLVGSIDFARADTVTATWTNPTQNNNGTTIPATGAGSLASARVEYGSCVGTAFGTKAGEVVRPMPVTTVTLNLEPGTTCVRVKVTNTYGLESGASNVSVRVVAPPTPNPPTNLTVTEPTAYDVKPVFERFAFERGRAVGTAKIGAACDETRTTGNDYFALERPSRVKLHREPRSAALVAKCS